MALEVCRSCYDGLGSMPRALGAFGRFGASDVDALNQLANDPSVQQALSSSGLQGKVSALLSVHGGDVRAALKSAGVSLNGALSSAGLPPELGGAIASGVGVLKAKGSEGKLKAAADFVQGLVNQSSGVAGQVGALGTGLLTRAVGLKMHSAGKLGGAGGSVAGQAAFGPAGAAVGQLLGTFAGEGVRAVGKALGIRGAKEHRETDEKNRERDDQKRLEVFHQQHPEVKRSSSEFLKLFKQGKVLFTSGVPGTKKWNESKHFRVVNGVLRDNLTRAEVDARPKDSLMLTSNAVSGWLIHLLMRREQLEAAEQLKAVKGALAASLVQAARNAPASTAPSAPTRRARQKARSTASPAAPQPASPKRTEAQKAATRRAKVARRPGASVPSYAQLFERAQPTYEQLVQILLPTV